MVKYCLWCMLFHFSVMCPFAIHQFIHPPRYLKYIGMQVLMLFQWQFYNSLELEVVWFLHIKAYFFWRIWRMKIPELRPTEHWEEWFMHWYSYLYLFWIYLIKVQLMCERLGLCRDHRSLMLPIRCSRSMSFNFHKHCTYMNLLV